MVIWLTSRQVDKWTSEQVACEVDMVTWEQISSLLQVTCLTCPLTLLLCLFRKQLVHSSTCPLVHLLCYSVFFASNLFTRLLVHLSTYYVTLSFSQATCSLVHLLCYFVFDTSNLSTNCLFLLNIKVNISIISIWVVWIIGVIRPILKKEYGERCKWLFVNELWEGWCKVFDHSKTVIA